MKKYLSFFLCIIMLIGLVTQTSAYSLERSAAVVDSFASGYVNGFSFNIYENYAELTGFDEELYSIHNEEYNTTHVLKLPGSVTYDNNEYPVTEITARFDPNTTFTTVIIPKTIKSITDPNAGYHDSSSYYRDSYCAFQYKTNLEYVIFEEGSELESMTGHGGIDLGYEREFFHYFYGCFYGCTNLKRIGIENTDKLPDGLTSIDWGTFYNCKSLKSITCPANLTEIGQQAFCHCTSLESITFSSKLTEISRSAFYDCTELKQLSFPATISYIGDYAFYNCTDLKKVTFETYKVGSNKGKSSLAYLGNGRFSDDYYNNDNYNSVFFNCTSLTTVELPLSINNYSIGYSCFENTALTSIDIPASVTAVGERAFANTKLENSFKTKDGQDYSVGFFGSDTYIDDNIFGDTYSNVDEDNVPKIAGANSNSTAFEFAAKSFGKEYFVNLGDYNPFHYPHSIVTTPAVKADCNHTGLTEGSHCSECGKILTEQKVIPKTEHNVVTVPKKEPTCAEEGLTEGKACSICGKIFEPQQTIPKTSHTAVIIKGHDATCSQEGLTDGKKCSVCGTVIEEQFTIPMIPHEYENGKCKICGAKDPSLTMRYDIDGDGEVTATDALIVLRASVGLDD